MPYEVLRVSLHRSSTTLRHASVKYQQPLKTKKSPMAVRPPGEFCNFGSMLRTMPPHEGTVQTLSSSHRRVSRAGRYNMITAAVMQRRQQPVIGMIARAYLMDLRQYSVFGQAHGYSPWYSR